MLSINSCSFQNRQNNNPYPPNFNTPGSKERYFKERDEEFKKHRAFLDNLMSKL